MLKVNKNQVILVLYTVFLMLISFAAQNMDNTFILSIASIPLILAVGINAIKNQNWIYVCFAALAAEVYYVLILWTFVIKGTETSWRIPYAVPSYNEVTMRYAFLSLLIICLIYFLVLYKESAVNFEFSSEKFTVGRLQTQLFIIVYGLIIMYYVVQLPTMGVRVYSESYNIMLQALFRACCLLSWIMLINADKKYKHILIAECVLGGIVAVIISVIGYRFVIVENVFMIVMLNLSKLKKIKLRTWITLIVFVLIFYVGLIYIKSVFTEREMSTLVFNHEKNIFYSFNAVYANIGETRLETYLSSIKNILPKALTGSTDVNTGGMLMRYIDYEAYLLTGVTMGGYYLTEAYANFGAAGIYIVSFIISIAFVALERARKGNPKYKQLFMCVYYGLVSQVYSIVYYGSSNYLKFFVYYIIFAFVIVMPITISNSGKGKKYMRKRAAN